MIIPPPAMTVALDLETEIVINCVAADPLLDVPHLKLGKTAVIQLI